MTEVLIEGCSVMLIGMGTVLVFLCIMIMAMHLMAYCICYLNKIFPEPIEVTTTSKNKKSSSNDEEVALAVVTAMFANNNERI